MAIDRHAMIFAGTADDVRRIDSGEVQPAVPRHAATVVLVRDRPEGPEIYMMRRVPSMAFAAGYSVFPGGSVDPRDQEIPDEAWVGPPPSEWARLFSADEPLARALVCAAVRETFEESGVMLAGTDADSVVADTSGDDWEADRLALLDRSLSLAELLARRGLMLRADLLRAWSHWITPKAEVRRFDTRFFVAAMPEGQRTRDVGGEADLVSWVRPPDAIAAFERSEITLMPPTIATLIELSGYDDVAAVLRAGDTRDFQAIMPALVVDENDGIRLLLPSDAGYPEES